MQVADQQSVTLTLQYQLASNWGPKPSAGFSVLVSLTNPEMVARQFLYLLPFLVINRRGLNADQGTQLSTFRILEGHIRLFTPRFLAPSSASCQTISTMHFPASATSNAACGFPLRTKTVSFPRQAYLQVYVWY